MGSVGMYLRWVLWKLFTFRANRKKWNNMCSTPCEWRRGSPRVFVVSDYDGRRPLVASSGDPQPTRMACGLGGRSELSSKCARISPWRTSGAEVGSSWGAAYDSRTSLGTSVRAFPAVA